MCAYSQYLRGEQIWKPPPYMRSRKMWSIDDCNIRSYTTQRRGGAIDVHTDRRGLLWILDEESVFPGGSDSSFLERVHMYHGEPNERGKDERGCGSCNLGLTKLICSIAVFSLS